MIWKIGQLVREIATSPTTRVFGIFASANMVSTILGGFAGLLQARWIDPAIMGRFNKYTIITGYVGIFLIFVADGLTRQYPYLVGKGAHEEAMKVASVAKFWYLLVANVAIFFFCLMSISSIIRGDWYGVVGWGAQIFVILQLTYGAYLQTMYRRTLEFKQLSYNGLAASVASVIFVVLPKYFGFWGMAIRHVMCSIVRVWVDRRYVPVKVKAVWDRATFCNLARISIPLSLVGYIRTSFITATFGFMVLRYCGEEKLGLYGVAAAFAAMAQTFVNSLWQIFNVKMTQRFGKDDSIAGTAKSLMRPTIFAVGVAVGCALILCVAIKPFVYCFVPKYVDSIPIVYVLSVGMILTALRLPTEVLRTALEYKLVYAVAIAKVVVVVGLMFIGPKTILWFAACSMFGIVSDVALGYSFLFRVIAKEHKQHL